jgi:hypothetical protein
VNITGEADFEIGLLSGSGVTVDASKLTGALTVTTELGDDTITGGSGVNTISLSGGVDTVNLSDLSPDKTDTVDTIYILGISGTDVTGAGVATITGFELDSDVLVLATATAVADTKFDLTASDLVAGTPDYSVYDYRIVNGVFDFGKAPAAETVNTGPGAELLDGIDIVFTDVVNANGESVAYTDGTDSWIFVSNDTSGYQAGFDTVVKLAGVVVTDYDALNISTMVV